MSDDDEQRQLRSACDDLVVEFGERLEQSEVAARFEGIVRRYDDAPIRTYVPVLAQREARAQLRELVES